MEQFSLPAILDIEASGFGKGSYPIEIGVMTEAGRQHSWLIRPEDDWVHWREEAEALHGISREKLLKEGLPTSEIADKLNELFEGQMLYSDGWGFDSGWLNLLYYVSGRKMFFKLDTLPKILSEYQLEHWDQTKAEIEMHRELPDHRAGIDAFLIQETYKKTFVSEQIENADL
ncbi:hypothetical protein QWZ13_12500 [Reinekea marina]|uniref:Exonuclease n=1 Tax=Reinekea marina TaxID=1310421 RepID=A0ABV7WX83_9GAMM|nr:hypothetical protein [Reinekea marina]MDN3649732.1 hypothetical protein [Reinekea marina]